MHCGGVVLWAVAAVDNGNDYMVCKKCWWYFDGKKICDTKTIIKEKKTQFGKTVTQQV